ncbi:hypothetical protein ACLM5H_01190 [Fredinandcohnia humi]
MKNKLTIVEILPKILSKKEQCNSPEDSKHIGVIIYNQEGNPFKAFGNIGGYEFFETILFKIVGLDLENHKAILAPIHPCAPMDNCHNTIIINSNCICGIQVFPILRDQEIAICKKRKRAKQKFEISYLTTSSCCQSYKVLKGKHLFTKPRKCKTNKRLIIPFSEINGLIF